MLIFGVDILDKYIEYVFIFYFSNSVIDGH